MVAGLRPATAPLVAMSTLTIDAVSLEALAMEAEPVARELHRLVKDLDPSRWRANLEDATRRRIADIESKLRNLTTRASTDEGLARPLVQIHSLLREAPEPDLPSAEVVTAWSGYRKRLQNAYEDLRGHLREHAVDVPTLRPTNYARSLSHAAIGLSLVFVVEEMLSAQQRWMVPVAFASFFWGLEAWRHFTVTGRRFLLWLFGPVAHPHERYRVNSSTWFGTALVIIGTLFGAMECAIAVGILGLADPAAGLIGRRFGKTKLVAERSLEGTLAFVVTGLLVALAILAIWHPQLGMGARLGIAFGAALFGGVAELFSNRVDDNMSVPVAAATGAFLAATLLGVG
jgi:dolichol kinase